MDEAFTLFAELTEDEMLEEILFLRTLIKRKEEITETENEKAQVSC